MTTGILIVNLGTPSTPTASAVRNYLTEFLSDPRVVEIPRWLWIPILRAIILPLRSKRTAKNYQKIWLSEGSPLMVYSKRLIKKLEEAFSKQDLCIELAMRYGEPTIESALKKFQQTNCSRIIVLPLFPQYSAATTASLFEEVTKQLHKWRAIPSMDFINQYAENSKYIEALTQSVQKHWKKHGNAGHLLMSFHGLPERQIKAGDPYQKQCLTTANLLAEKLQLQPTEYTVAFQSRFGKAKWIEPYCDQTLQQMPARGIKRIDVICPGFAVDCLETLEEIAQTNAELFHAAGGEYFSYIPALNDSIEHQEVLTNILLPHIPDLNETLIRETF